MKRFHYLEILLLAKERISKLWIFMHFMYKTYENLI